MGYSDQKYYARPLLKVAAAIAFGTATAAGTASNSLAQPAATVLQNFVRRTKIDSIQVVCVTAEGGTQVGPINFTVLNGTNTVGFIAIQTATVGQVFTVGGAFGTTTAVINGTASTTALGTLNNTETGTATYSVFGTGSAPTVALIGTFTASGATSGTWDLWLSCKEKPEDDAF
jgi:hypothetical protein